MQSFICERFNIRKFESLFGNNKGIQINQGSHFTQGICNQKKHTHTPNQICPQKKNQNTKKNCNSKGCLWVLVKKRVKKQT